MSQSDFQISEDIKPNHDQYTTPNKSIKNNSADNGAEQKKLMPSALRNEQQMAASLS